MTEHNNRLPRVVVAGRPNVGKSTLFNRLLRKRRAITDPTPGVTRDAVREICSIAGRDVLLIDTGGYKAQADGVFDDSVSRKSLEMIGEADLVLFLLDVAEVTSEDEILLKRLRPHADKVMLVVNKIDTPEKDDLIWNFHSYGYEKVVGVSAVHSRGIGELTDLVRESLDHWDYDAVEEEPTVTRIAVLGKPNVGKSTLANSLTGTENSIVSDVAGTTRDIVQGEFEYRGRRYRLLDTAGIRRKSKVTEDVEYYSVNRALKAIDESDLVLLMMDAVEGLSEQDKKIAQQIIKKGKGVIIVLNKWDLVSGGEKAMKEAKEMVRFKFPILGFAPIVPVSALKNARLDKLMQMVEEVMDQLNRRIETSELNRALADWFAFNPIPMVKGKSYKVRYINQVSVAPVRFLMFVNREKGFPEAYVRFVMNNIREHFGYSLVPLEVDVRES